MITLTFRVSHASLPDLLRVLSLTGEESLTQPFCYDVKLAFGVGLDGPAVNADLLKGPATITFLEDGEEVRRVTGIVAEAEGYVSGDATSAEGVGIALTIVPRMWLLSEFHTTEVFLEKSIPEIIAKRLQSIGLSADEDFVISLRSNYPRREIVVQYEEDGLSFVNRLCEHWGITYYFEQRGDKDVVVFTDHSELFESFDPSGASVPFFGRGDPLGIVRHGTTIRRVPRQVVLNDYNYRAPQLAMTATRQTAKDASEGEIFLYGDHAKSPAEAALLANVRAEQVQCERLVVRGASRKMRFRPGSTFLFEDASGGEAHLLLTRVVHHAELEGSDTEPTYRNTYEAIDKATPFRPRQRTPKPKVQGLMHGVIDGAVKGPYAEIDDAGRYRVHFRYDRSGRTDLTASHPVRLMQTHGGTDYGMHFPFRPGTEVLIGFVEGDPDRPIIVGAAPNPQMHSPVSRRNHTQNVLRSQSRNELVMEDLDGQQRIRLATPNNNTVLQLGSIEEPELGALIRSDGNVTSAAGRAITDAAPLRTTMAVQATTLVADNIVQLAGLTGLGAVIGQGAHDHGRVDRRSADVLAAVSALGAFPSGAATSPPPNLQSGGATKTWSALGANLAGHAQREAANGVQRMTFRTRRLSSQSSARASGQPLATAEGPHAIVGSSNGATLFARDEALVFADHIATLSSDEVTRVVGGLQVEIQSPQEIEIAGRRALRLTSASLVDVQGGQVYLRGAIDPPEAEDFPPEDVSIAILADRTLRMKSANGAFIACAEKKLVLHSHHGSADLSAEGDVHIAGGSIHATAGTISMASSHVTTIHAKEDLVLKADADVHIEAQVQLDVNAISIVVNADGEITIRGGKITIEGPTTIDGPLTVNGSLNTQ